MIEQRSIFDLCFLKLKLVLVKLQVFGFTLLDLLISTDLGEKKVFRTGFFSFLLGKLVGNLQGLRFERVRY